MECDACGEHSPDPRAGGRVGAQSEKEEKGWGRKLAGAKAVGDGGADWTLERRLERCAKTRDLAGRTARPQGARADLPSPSVGKTRRGVVLNGPTPGGPSSFVGGA